MSAFGAGEACAEGDFFAFLAVHGGNNSDAVSKADGGLEGLGQPLLQILAHLEAVNHYFNAVLTLLVERWRFVQFVDASIDACAHKALGAQLVDQCQVLALAIAQHRGQQHQLAAFGHGQYLVDHLADGLGGQWQIVVRAHGRAHPGKQQAQVVVNFGDGADGGARVV